MLRHTAPDPSVAAAAAVPSSVPILEPMTALGQQDRAEFPAKSPGLRQVVLGHVSLIPLDTDVTLMMMLLISSLVLPAKTVKQKMKQMMMMMMKQMMMMIRKQMMMMVMMMMKRMMMLLRGVL